MKKPTLVLTISMLAAYTVYANSGTTLSHEKDRQVVYRAESQQSFKGPEEWFTGDVQVDILFPANETAHFSGAYVTFQPGARTVWHLHPGGQHRMHYPMRHPPNMLCGS